jgi:hypothetical protein
MGITLRHLSALCVGVALTMTTSAFATDPSAAQRAAVKSNCRDDFISHCIGVTPGGKPAFDCLAKHMSSLSGSCQAAVKDIQALDAAPATPSAAPATGAAAPAAEPAKTTAPAKGADTTPKAASTAPAKPTSDQKAAVKSNCRSDFIKFCRKVSPGGDAAMECLAKNAASLSPSCQKAVAAASGGGGAPPAAAAAAPAR